MQLHGLFLEGTAIIQMTVLTGNLHTAVLQVYYAMLLANISKICQNLTKILQKLGEILFIWTQCTIVIHYKSWSCGREMVYCR